MQEILKKLDKLEERVQQMAQKMEYLRKENLMLIEENVKLKQEFEKNSIGNKTLGHKGRNGNREENGSGLLQSDQLRRELSKYIGEVDKCIELINNM